MRPQVRGVSGGLRAWGCQSKLFKGAGAVCLLLPGLFFLYGILIERNVFFEMGG